VFSVFPGAVRSCEMPNLSMQYDRSPGSRCRNTIVWQRSGQDPSWKPDRPIPGCGDQRRQQDSQSLPGRSCPILTSFTLERSAVSGPGPLRPLVHPSSPPAVARQRLGHFSDLSREEVTRVEHRSSLSTASGFGNDRTTQVLPPRIKRSIQSKAVRSHSPHGKVRSHLDHEHLPLV